MAYNNNDYEKALILFEQKRHEARKQLNAAADDGRGWALMALQRLDAAQIAFEEALQLDPHYISSQKGLDKVKAARMIDLDNAHALMRDGEFRKSQESINKARIILPDQNRYLAEIAQGWLFYYSGDFIRASSRFQQLVHLYPDSHHAMLGLGMSLIARDQYQEGYHYIRDAIVKNPHHDIEKYYEIAEQITQYGTIAQLLPLMIIGADYYPEDGGLSWIVATTALNSNQIELATEYVLIAARYDPQLVDSEIDNYQFLPHLVRDAYADIAFHYYNLNDFNKAQNRYRQYLASGGNDLEAIRGYGLSLFRAGQIRESIAFLRKAASGEPDKIGLLQQNLIITDNDGNEESFLIHYNATSMLGWLYLNIEDPTQAAKYFEFATKDYPELVDAWTGLGIAYTQMGNSVRASQAFERALNIIPNYPEALKGIANLSNGGNA